MNNHSDTSILYAAIYIQYQSRTVICCALSHIQYVHMKNHSNIIFHHLHISGYAVAMKPRIHELGGRMDQMVHMRALDHIK